MKLKTFVICGIAVSSLIACSNNDEIGSGSDSIKNYSDLVVNFKLDGSKTRGVIEDGANTKPIFKNTTVYVFSGNDEVINQNVELKEDGTSKDLTGKAEFTKILLGGKENVIVTANVGDGDVSAAHIDGRSIENIQPNENQKTLENIYYYGSSTLTEKGTNNYEAKIDLAPVAARVEVFGNVDFNDTFVKELTVDVITPLEYTGKYNDASSIVKPKTEKHGELWLDLTDNNYTSIKDENTKVVANHLFGDDVQKIAMRIKSQNYILERSLDETMIIFNLKDGSKSPIYRNMNNELAAKSGEKYIRITKNEEGYAEGDEITGFEPSTEAKEGFYTMVNFGTVAGEGGDLTILSNGKYEPGYIYRIDLGKIDWSGDQNYNSGLDKFNPEENGTGTEEPAYKSDLSVVVTVKEWTKEHVIPGIEK